MKNALIYSITVLIWGSTWLAIEYQVGVVPVEVSVIYRFGFAALLMMLYCFWRQIPLTFSMKDHAFIFLLGILNFGLNYLIVYHAQIYLNSAMTCIVFSTMVLMNIVNTRLFFGKKIARKTYLGALFGISGITALFYPEIEQINFESDILLGLLLALIATFVASVGNMVSVRNSNHGLGIIPVNALGMLYATGLMLIFALAKGTALTLPSLTSYWIALAYLSVFGSVIAFACYFTLLKNIGPEKASYIIVLFPFVAIALSTVFEDFTWQLSTYLGVLLVAIGNILILLSRQAIKTMVQKLKAVRKSFVKTFSAANRVKRLSRAR